MLPTKQQWKKWSLPSKVGYVGTSITILGFVISIIFYIFPPPLKDEGKAIFQQQLKNQITTEISKIVQSCETEKNKENGYGPSTTVLVLQGAKAIPTILDFIAESVQTDMDLNNPLFLLNYRKQLVDKPGLDCLVDSILKICRNDSSKEYQKYFQELLLKKEPTVRDFKKIIFLSYILWNFNDTKLLDIQNQLLTRYQPPIFDAVKKVLLRSYLFRNEEYFPIHWNTVIPSGIEPEKFAAYNSEFKKLQDTNMSEALGVQNIKNWQKMFLHIFSYDGMYDSFYEVSKDNHVNVKSFSAEKNKKRFRSCLDQYLFGYDFSMLNLKYLEINRVLLGKSFFHKSLLEHLKTNESNLIECEIHDSKIRLSTVNKTVFDYCEFKEAKLGRFSIFDATIFQDSLLTDSSLLESFFYRCEFTRCQIKNMRVSASIFIDCEFKNNTFISVTFYSVFMDEKSMNNFFENSDVSQDDFTIKVVGYSDESQSKLNWAATALSLQTIIWQMYNPSIVSDYLLRKAGTKKLYMITSKVK